VFATVDDIAGKAAETEGELSPEVKKSAQKNEESPENENCAAEFAKRVHSRILLQGALKSFPIAFVTY
jgi:hypothetical protein